VFGNISHAQALADLVVTNLGSTRKCTRASGWKDFEVNVSGATFESGIGTPHLTVTGAGRACLVSSFPVSFTLTMPVHANVTRDTITFGVDPPTTDLPAPINGIVSSLVYKQAQKYASVFRISLSSVVPKEVFLFNPQLGPVTAAYGNDALSARVSLSGQITSAAATKALNDRLQAGNLHF
jgi:hypothetical protein